MPVRKIKATYSSLTGKFASRKMGRHISWESALERDLFYLLEFDPSVKSYAEQPITIYYSNKSYIPDVLVNLKTKSSLIPRLEVGDNLVEVKYLEELKSKWLKLKPKYRAAISHCKSNNSKFKLITDNLIRSQLLENIKIFEHHMRRESHNEIEMRQLFHRTLSQLHPCSIGTLLAACFRNKQNRSMAMPVIWRMIGEHTIGVDITETIDLNSEVWLME